MRILIDMQGAQTESRFRGIGRYTLSFAQGIVRNRGEHEVFLALSGLFPETIESIRAAFNGLLPQENIRVWYAPGSVREIDPTNAWRRDVAELIREAFFTSLQPDVIHISSLFEGYVDDAVTSIGRFDNNIPVSVSLYDLIPLVNPEKYFKPNPGYRLYYENKINSLLSAHLQLAISDFSRNEGLKHLDVVLEKIVNISTAIDSCFKPIEFDEVAAATINSKLGITRPFVLYTGGADERKDLPNLIKAYARLGPTLRKTHQLVLAGKVSVGDLASLRHVAKQVGLTEGDVCFTGYVSDAELLALYNLCTVFVFPSWHEGFGLPVLEAMACGAAVIGANATSLPEVIGNSDALFEPHDCNDLAIKMRKVLEDKNFREELRVHGLAQAKKFSWDLTALRAITAFQNVAISHCKSKFDINTILKRLTLRISNSIKHEKQESDIMEIAIAIDRSFPVKVVSQLFVDISELAKRDAKTGVQRVTRSIVQQLLLAPPVGYVIEPVYATANRNGYRYARKFMKTLGAEVTNSDDELISTRPGDIFLGLDLQHHTTLAQAPFLSQARDDGVLIYFIIYDLLPIQFPNYWPTGVSELHHDWLYSICKWDGVICISNAVMNELEVWLKDNGPPRLRPLEVKWFHLGSDMENSGPSKGLPDNAEEILRGMGSRLTFLSVGTIEPRKGQAQTLAAFELLWQTGSDINLVLVGKQGWMVDALAKKIRNHVEIGKHLFWLDGVSDEYLERIYAESACLIAASEGEGFGLPLIEAAQHNLSIIARNIPVFQEVAGEHAFYFDGSFPNDLADAIKAWLILRDSGIHPKSQNMSCISWRDSALQLKKQLRLMERS